MSPAAAGPSWNLLRGAPHVGPVYATAVRALDSQKDLNDAEIHRMACHALGVSPEELPPLGAAGSETPLGPLDVQHGKKRKKRSRHRKRSRHGRSRSRSSRTSGYSSDSSVFRLATGRGAGRENPIQEVARLRPGRLFQEGLKTMSQFCDPSQVIAGGGNSSTATKLPPTAYRYLTTLV